MKFSIGVVFSVSNLMRNTHILLWLLVIICLLLILLYVRQSRKLSQRNKIMAEFKQLTIDMEQLQNKAKQLEEKMANYQQQKTELDIALAKLEEWNKLVPELREIARLDHDINTPLCVVTLSLGRAQKVGREQHDEALLSMVNDILGAVDQIGEIMQKVAVLKKSPLISYKSGGNNVGEERGTV